MANVNEPDFTPREAPAGFRSRRARIGRELGSELIGCSVWEVPAGEAAYPYHFHYSDEELVIVLAGRPTLRTPDGTRELDEGEVVRFPLGPDGAHAVDAAVAAVLTSFVAESPLTGLGAGGFMLVHTADEDVLLDFFVEMPGRGVERTSELVPVEILFDGTAQIFNIGAASCGVPGAAAGLAEALERFGSAPLPALTAPAAHLARDGVVLNEQQAYLHELLTPVLTKYPESRALYAPDGEPLRAGDVFRFPELGDALERYAAEGPSAIHGGETAAAIAAWVVGRGGTLTADDLAAYAPIAREPVIASFRGRQILSNPPPSAGGILIVFALAVLERVGSVDLPDVVGAMEEAQAARTEAFHRGLYEAGFTERLLGAERLDAAAARVASGRRPPAGIDGPADRLGSTTHISVLDAA